MASPPARAGKPTSRLCPSVLRCNHPPKTMKSLLTVIVALSCMMLSGCATVSPEQIQAEVAKVGYGAPLPADWQETVKAFMETRLKDSVSAIYKFGEPYQGYLTKAPIEGGGLKAAGYLVNVKINAKNSYGGYVGFTDYSFLIRDGVVISYCAQTGEFAIWQ